MSWNRERVLISATAAAALVLLTATASIAQDRADHRCEGQARIGEDGGEAGGTCGQAPRARPAAGQDCDPDGREVAYYADIPSDLSEARSDRWLAIMRRQEQPEGMVWQAAFNCAGLVVDGPLLRPDPGWVDVEAVREQARARVTPPVPEPNVSPVDAIVAFPTWLWIDDDRWGPVSASASQGSVSVRVDASPLEVRWDLVEGTRTCQGPGIPWAQDAHDVYEAQPVDMRGRGNPACTFTFVNSSTVEPDDVYRASVTVVWEFSWWLNGQPRGRFGTVEASTPFELRVGEVQALITGY